MEALLKVLKKEISNGGGLFQPSRLVDFRTETKSSKRKFASYKITHSPESNFLKFFSQDSRIIQFRTAMERTKGYTLAKKTKQN